MREYINIANSLYEGEVVPFKPRDNRTDSEKYDDALKQQTGREPIRSDLGTIPCPYCEDLYCNIDCDAALAAENSDYDPLEEDSYISSKAYAKMGLMKPRESRSPFYRNGSDVEYYAPITGEKIQGIVVHNDAEIGGQIIISGKERTYTYDIDVIDTINGSLLDENASAGASAAGGIATAMGGLGSGDPKASIYYRPTKTKKKDTKSSIIKRNMK